MGQWKVLAGMLASASAAEQWVRQDFTVLPNYTYAFNLLVGTPPQQVTVDIDFASADIRLLSGPNSCATGCDPDGFYLGFNTSASLTYSTNHTYTAGPRLSDGSFVTQAWGWDDIQLGGVTISNAVLALGADLELALDAAADSTGPAPADSSAPLRNLFGIGPRVLQMTLIGTDDEGNHFYFYDEAMRRLTSEGYTRNTSYSIWVDPIAKASGRLLFGAVDRSLYTGELTAFPALLWGGRDPGDNTSPYVSLAVISVQYALTNGSSPVLFSGTFAVEPQTMAMNSRMNLTMPESLLVLLGGALGATWSERLAYYVLNCELGGTITLDLGGISIPLKLSDFMTPLDGVSDVAGRAMCTLNIELSQEGLIYVPNQVLLNYYIVVDFDSGMVSLGTPVAATGAASLQPIGDQPYSTAPLGFVVSTASRTVKAFTPATLAADVSSYYLLGGPPEPSRLTGTGALNRPASATVAGNRARAASPFASGLLYVLLLILP